MGAEFIHWLVESTLASSAAIMAVLLLRNPARRVFGAGIAYALWMLVPTAWLATLLPAPVIELAIALSPVRIAAGAGLTPVAAHDWNAFSVALPLWMTGCAYFSVTCWRRQRNFLRQLGGLSPRADGLWQATSVCGLPAVIGLRPRIVVPADFDTRYRDDERALILTHERIHARRGDLAVQALVLVLRTIYWFNPLAWFAAERARRDQELACDAGVIAKHPTARRTYAEAMVKTSLGTVPAPLACHWAGAHPLKERLAMLKHATPSRRTLLSGACAIVLLTAGAGFAAWALQTPQTRAKTSGDAPASSMSGSTQSDAGRLHTAIDLHVQDMPLRAVVKKVESLSGVHVLNPDAISTTHLVTLDFKKINTLDVLRVLAEENDSTLEVRGASVRFVRRATGQPGAASDTVPAPAQGVTRTTPPAYPPAALAAKQDGKVVLRLLVGVDGTVKDAKVDTSTAPGVFDAAALQAARAWKLKPAIENGQPAEGWVQVPITFEANANRNAKPSQAVPQA